MDYAAAAEGLMRKRLMESMYDRMTDEEKRLFVQMTLQQRSTDDILNAIQRQSLQIQDVRENQQTFVKDFTSNLAGNAVWDGAVWLMTKLLRRLR